MQWLLVLKAFANIQACVFARLQLLIKKYWHNWGRLEIEKKTKKTKQNLIL